MPKIYGNEGATPKDAGIEWGQAKPYKKIVPVHAIKMKEDFEIEHKDGKMKGKKGDYLIQGKRGDKYPLSAELFEETHEEMAPMNVRDKKIKEQEQEIETLKKTIEARDNRDKEKELVIQQLNTANNGKPPPPEGI